MSDALHAGGESPSPSGGAEHSRERRGGGKDRGLAPALEVQFEDGDISPDKILVPDLARVVRAVQRLAAGPIPEDSGPLPDGDKLRLVKVLRGSARYALAGPSRPIVAANLRVLGAVIDQPDQIGDNDYLLQPVRILSVTAAKLGCRISIREPGHGGEVLARIGPETYGDLTKSVLVTGQTEFGGRVERVGGATRSRCGLRVAFQKRMLICRVPESTVARLLGENLYKRVIVSGEASWIRTTWSVYSFRIESARPLKDGSLLDKIRAIREAGGSDWDRISDLETYLDLESTSSKPVRNAAPRTEHAIGSD